MLRSKTAVGYSKGKMALRFLTKGTGCGVESEVIYRSMELRDRNKFEKLDRNPKKKNHRNLNYRCFFVDLSIFLTRCDKVCDIEKSLFST